MDNEKPPKKEVVIRQQAVEENQVAGFIEQAIAKNLPVEVMEKLFTLHGKVKADRAKDAFTASMAQFQTDIPVINKTKKVLNKDGTLRYQFAPLDSIIAQIKKPLSENGLSYTWEVENKPGFIKAIAKVTHVMGHSETSAFEVPIDEGGFMTTPQKYASALTFAKRYALVDALGISTADEDIDASDTGPEQKSPLNEKSRIVLLLRQLGRNTETKESIELAVKQITQLSLIAKNFGEIINRLEVSVKEKQEYDHENQKV